MKWKGAVLPEQWRQVWDRYKYMLAVVLIGLVLLMLPARDSAPAEQAGSVQDVVFSTAEMEEKMEHALGQINGAGEVTVVLTLQAGSRRVLAQDTQTDETHQRRDTVVVSQGSGVEQPVVVQQVGPQYQGALVVCSGGADPGVKLEILNAVRVLTGLSADKISICKRK